MAAPLAACSNKALVFLVVPLLLMALLAAPAPAAASRAGCFQFQQGADGQYCLQVRVCKEDLCSGTCAVLGIAAGVGQCKVVGGVPTCCCVVPTKPSASVVGVHSNQLAH